MLHLVYSPLLQPSPYSINKQTKSILLYGIRISGFDNYPLLAFKKTRRIGALEKDSEFEVDPDKAREALRKLDEQFQSLSNKQISSPKIRAVEVNQASPGMTEEASGSFWGYLASALLIFTIVYNVVFITVIKPSVDGEDEPVYATNVTEGAQNGVLVP